MEVPAYAVLGVAGRVEGCYADGARAEGVRAVVRGCLGDMGAVAAAEDGEGMSFELSWSMLVTERNIRERGREVVWSRNRCMLTGADVPFRRCRLRGLRDCESACQSPNRL